VAVRGDCEVDLGAALLSRLIAGAHPADVERVVTRRTRPGSQSRHSCEALATRLRRRSCIAYDSAGLHVLGVEVRGVVGEAALRLKPRGAPETCEPVRRRRRNRDWERGFRLFAAVHTSDAA
jgi:hypothetical protein